MQERNNVLSALWILETANFIIFNVITSMYFKDLKQILGCLTATQGHLLVIAGLMGIPALMIFLSKNLHFGLNKTLNINAGIALTVIQAGTLFTVSNTMHYLLFSIIEISIALCITFLGFSWDEANN